MYLPLTSCSIAVSGPKKVIGNFLRFSGEKSISELYSIQKMEALAVGRSTNLVYKKSHDISVVT